MSKVNSSYRVSGICAICALLLSMVGFATHGFGATVIVPDQYGSIQLAIDAVQDGDTVLVQPGTYVEPLSIVDKSVVLRSSGGALQTSLSAGVTENVITLSGPESSGSVIEGFLIEGGMMAIWCRNSGPTIRRNVLKDQNITNWGAISLGGAEYGTIGVSPAVIENNTIAGCVNGGISTFSSAAPTIQNTIIAFNGHYGIHREGNGSVAQPVLAYNDVFGNPVAYQEIASPGTGSIALSPLFQSDYRLSPGSPCIDAGNPAPDYNDPDGSRNDMGAHPLDSSGLRPPMTIRVPLDAPTIQQAINDAINGDTVLVAPGIYAEQIDFYGKVISLLSEAGPSATLIGIPREVPWPQAVDKLQAAESPSEAVAQAGKGTDVVPDQSKLNAIFPAVIRMSGSMGSSITGFTIDGGETIRGLFAENSNPTVEQCIFQHCFGGYDGGAMYFQFGAPKIIDNIVRYNYTPISGGGIFVRLGYGYGRVSISGNKIHDNVSGNGAAIALIEGDDAHVVRNKVYHNSATQGSQRRGAVYFRGRDILALNNTICGNTVGLTVLSSEDCNIRNNILSLNSAVGLELLSDVGPNQNVTYDYNLVWGNTADYYDATPAAHDLNTDPLFESSLPYGFYLRSDSPCRDAGDPDPVYNDPDGSRNDIGAVPYEAVNPHIPITYFVPNDFSTIKLAMEAAETGDTILVLPGTYFGQVRYMGKDVVLKSVNGPLETTITSSPTVDLVVFSGGESRFAVLEGFTLEGGHIGVLCKNAAPTIRRNILVGQTITNWGAISLGGGSYGTVGVSPALIENNTIVNSANGGISTFSGIAPTIRNNIIAFNSHYGIHREGSSSVAQPVLAYNDVFGSPVLYQEVTDFGPGSISLDPTFGPAFQLLGTSPCINAGDPDPFFNDPDGSRNDMGAIFFDGAVVPLPDTVFVPDDFADLQQAIAGVNGGGTILVRPGTYSGPFVIFGKSIEIMSTDGPTQTVLTASSDENVITFNGSASSQSVLSGFQIRGGKIGVWCRNSGPTLRRNVLYGQNITDWGAISLGGTDYGTVGASPAVIENNTILNCANGGISTFSSLAPVIRNNIIAFNSHYGIHREGFLPGVAQPGLSYNDVFGSPVLYQEIPSPGIGSISENPLLGPGFILTAASPCIDAGDPDIEFNDPDGSRNDMGAIPFDSTNIVPPADTVYVPIDVATISEAVVVVNDGGIIWVAPGIYDGGVVIEGKSVTLKSTDGPLQTTVTGPGSLDLITVSGPAASGSTVEGFTLSGGRIGIWCRDSGPTIMGNLLVGQTIYNWGAISLSGQAYGTVGASPATIVNNTVVNAENGAISTFSSVAPTIKNNILAYNAHYGIHREGSPSVAQPILAYNDVFGNPVAYQEILDVGVGTIALDPLFTPNWSLTGSSPCIDAGDPDSMYNDPNGSRNDIGAIPYNDSVVLPADTIYVPDDVASIQAAINIVLPGGAVIVGPGTYNGPILITGKSVTLVSSGGAAVTTLQAVSSVNVITVSGQQAGASVIEGFTIKEGYIGVRCINAGPTIRRNLLVDQTVPNWGAISLGGSSYASVGPCPALIENNTIVACANGAISTFSDETPTIRNNILAFNAHYGIHREGSSAVAQPALSYNDVFGNPVSYQEIADEGIGSISLDPLFDDGYILTAASPCIDAGDPAAGFNDPDGSRNDIGVFPYVEPTSHMEDGSELPHAFSVRQNYPNPFNPATIIEFTVPQPQNWTVEVFSVLGQRVFSQRGRASAAGVVRVEFDGSDLASGVYLYRITAGRFVDSRKMILVK